MGGLVQHETAFVPCRSASASFQVVAQALSQGLQRSIPLFYTHPSPGSSISLGHMPCNAPAHVEQSRRKKRGKGEICLAYVWWVGRHMAALMGQFEILISHLNMERAGGGFTNLLRK
jgi:hypothetical protein